MSYISQHVNCVRLITVYNYIGETSKRAYKCLLEHWLAKCNKNSNLSSIAEHFNLYHNSHTLSKDNLN